MVLSSATSVRAIPHIEKWRHRAALQAEFGVNLVPPIDDDAQRVGKLESLIEFVAVLVLEDCWHGVQEIESMLKARSDVLFCPQKLHETAKNIQKP